MSDSRIRCALVFNLADGATLLTKLDYASKSEGGDLYGSKEKDFAVAVAAVVRKDPPGSGAEAGTLGGFKVVQSDMHQLVYGADKDGVCCAVIAGVKYPSRIAIKMLNELYGQFTEKYGSKIANSAANSFTRKSKSMLTAICKKYDDLKNVDKASALIGKVDGVKNQMQTNITQMLQNTDKADSIAQQSEQLNEQANVFKKKSTVLKKQMRCKNLKTTIILVSIVVGILLIILVPLITKMMKARAAQGN